MIRHPKKDAVTIGVGWVGGILADEMTKAGMSVVGLERGTKRPVDEFRNDQDELAYAVHGKLFQDPAFETQTLRHSMSERALPMRRLGSWLPGTGVGGAGLHWNGQTWRFHPSDFQQHSHYIGRYGKNVFSDIDPNLRPRDWGITYDTLEPYFDKFEYMAGISGEAGVLNGVKTGVGNPFEGSRSRQYPTPPMEVPLSGNMYFKAAKAAGYHPFNAPSANLSQPYVNPEGVARHHCMYCGFCERFGCEVGSAKASPNVTVIPVAMQTGLYEIRERSWVRRIVHRNGHAQGVVYIDSAGRENFQPADIVIVSAFMLSNVRLLLLSNLGTPYDPKTEKGAVGRNFTYQLNTGATAFFEDEDAFNVFMGSGALQTSIDDFNADNFDHAGLGFIGGGGIGLSQSGSRPILGQSVPTTVTQSWGSEWKAALRKYYRRKLSVGVQGESNAYRQHFLDLDPTYRDGYGDPLLRATFDWERNEVKCAAFLGKQATKLAQALSPKPSSVTPGGEIAEHFDTTVYQSTHVCGGTIMGDDPKQTVVNDYLQMWDAPNVFVIGANNFPQNAGFNPTGTVGALAYRAADGIVNHYIKDPGPIRS